jgi:hypothetical protein
MVAGTVVLPAIAEQTLLAEAAVQAAMQAMVAPAVLQARLVVTPAVMA